MSDTPYVRRQVQDTFFIHNVFGSFFSGVLDWFGDEFYPRFEYKVIGTYDKAVKFFNDKKQMGVDPSDKFLPSLSLDPMLDFSNEERGGRFLWQHSRYAPTLGMYMFKKGIDLKEQDVKVNPVFSRYQGTFEITFWLSSIYELLDFRVALLQYCGGYNRWLRPKFFWSYLILPEQIQDFETNANTGEKLDWSNTTADLIHVDTINKQKLGIPIALDPIWRLESFGDSSTKYGGDSIAEYKLSATFGYEINIPTYIVLSRGLDPHLNLSFSIGKTYTKYPLVSPFKILQAVSKIDTTNKYFEKNYKLFSVTQEDEFEHLLLKFSPNSITYPSKFSQYNYIVSGTLLNYTSTSIEVHKEDILYFENYRDEFLPAIRKCAGVICKNDTLASVLYSKCESLKKPLITYLSDLERDVILSNIGAPITIDSLAKKLYSGLLASVEITEKEKVLGFDAVKHIQQDSPEMYNVAVEGIEKTDINAQLSDQMGGPEDNTKMKRRLLKDLCNGIQTRFDLGYILDNMHKENLAVYVDDTMLRHAIDYTIENNSAIILNVPPEKGSSIYLGGQYTIVRDSKLVAIYEFSDLDVQDLSKKVIVSLPSRLEREQDMILISYSGKLEYERDYTFDRESQTVTILLKPKVGEIVQFFYYVSEW